MMRKGGWFALPAVMGMLLLAACDGGSEPQALGTADGGEPVGAEVTIEGRRFSPEALWALARMGEFAVAPDGERVAVTFTRYSMEENKGCTELYVLRVDGGERHRIPLPGTQCYNLQWGADGAIRFVSAPEGDAQIYRVNPDGSGLQKISSVEQGIDGFRISPDGSHILYAATVRVHRGVAERHPDLPKATGLIYDDLMYRHWDSWDEGTRSHIFVAPLADGLVGKGADVLEGTLFDSPLKPFGGMEEVGWAADSRGFAYTCKKLLGREAAFSTNSDIYFYDLATGTTRNLTEGYPGYDRCPVFSPDGRYMAWSSMARAGFEADKDRLMIMELASGQVRELSARFDHSPSGLVWTPDSQGLYFVAGVNGTSQIYHQALGDELPRAVTRGCHDYHSVALAAGCLLGDRVSMLAPASLFRVALEDGAEAEITTDNHALLQRVDMPRVTERWVRTSDGKQMLTWVLLPPAFDSARAYPALLYCEGGPQSSLTQFWSYRWNLALMASQGYVVVAPNRRGTLTFGQEWTDAISRDHGGQEMRDLLAAIDEVAKEPWVDANRLGAVGASYGGYTVNWLAGHHDGRFKAFISHCGIFHSEMEFYTTEELFFDEWEMGGKPWDKQNRVAQASFAQSPHHFVEKWDTPIMIIHGGRDYRIPYTQGMAAFNAARMRGIESRFLFFPDESHWVLKPQNGLLWQREFFAWLDGHLK